MAIDDCLAEELYGFDAVQALLQDIAALSDPDVNWLLQTIFEDILSQLDDLFFIQGLDDEIRISST